MSNPTNIRDPEIPVTLGAFRALQDEVRRLDAEIARLRGEPQKCEGCNGTGSYSVHSCLACNGTGEKHA